MVKTSSKSSHHKDTNRFKFQSFSDQIAHINIDVIHQSKRTESSPKYADSFFAEGLAKWKELNCTQDFVNFSHEILGQVQSFAQLVHFEDKIVGALKNHLRVSNSMAYLPLMDLVVQLARDLQMDFYPHFPEFFDIVVSLLDTQDAELIEGAFQCLCYLFKFLWRYLVRDIHDVYRMYSPLLSEDQRPHIRQFAAESFAFLMRKVKGHGQLFDAMLGSLEENPEKARGLGRLFFDMLKGVRHQVHSYASKILPVLLSRLGPCPRHEECKDVPTILQWELVLDSFQETILCLCGYLQREHSNIIWHTFLEEVAFLERKLENMSSGPTKDGVIGQLSRLVILLQQMVQWGSGHLVLEPRKLCEATARLVSKHYLPETDGAVALSLLVGLLKTKKAHLSQEDTSILIQVLFDNEYSSRHILHATRSLFPLPGFEQDILPSLCEYCHAKMASQDEVETVLFTLTKLIVLKSPQVEVGSDLVDYIPYCIDFSRHIQISLVKQKKLQRKSLSPPNFPDHLMSCLETALSSNLTSDDHFHDLWAALVCIPHVKPLDHSKCQSRIQDIILRLVQTLDEETAEKKDEKTYVLSAAIQSLLLISKSHHPTDVLKMSLVHSLLRTCPTSPHILLAASCYFSLCEVFGPGSKTEGIVTADTLNDLYPHLEQNLLAPSSLIRRLTLQILNNLPVTLPSSQDLPLPQVSIFRLCLQAEETPVAVETYRDRLKCLRKLEHTLAKHNIPVGNFESVPLRYLISQLYVNFQLLWDPVGDIIKTHAYEMDKKLFWDVYSQALHSAASHTEQNLFYIRSTQMHQTQHIDASINSDTTEVSSLPGLFSHCQGDASSSMDRPDHGNFRRLLWKTMENFPNRAEGRSRELSPLLLRFMKKEFYVTDVSNAPTQNLCQVKGQPKDHVTESSEEENGGVKGKRKRPMNKALVAQLNLFSKFKDPKSLYLEPELRQLYLNLLASRNPDVQKAALACLYTYNYKYLSPYRENLDQLMDDKLFRDALVHFGIDTTSGIVKPVDREGLLPVLLRILYGKMLSKTGPGTQGKSGIATRRSVILRFIAGSSAAEMKVFIDLVLEPCQHLIQDNLSEMLRLWTSEDPAAIVPLRKQLSTLDTIGVIFSKLGHLIDPYLSLLLGIITCAVASYNTLLLQRNELVPFCITQLKNLRQTGICRLIEFFERFEEYPFTALEVETIFEAVVFPQVGKLSSDSSTGPTPVLRLAHCWSQYVRYHPLLVKPHPDDRNLTLLDQAMVLLTMPKVGSAVVAMVMEIVENLLTQEEEEEGEMDGERDGCDFIPGVSLDSVEEGPYGAKLNIGTRMLLPYVPVILSHLKSAIQIKQVPTLKAAPVLPVKELGILYKISVFAQASELCSSLIGLLLPYLQKSSSVPQGTDVEILTTVRNLMKLVDDPGQFLSVLSRLLYCLTSEPARMVLVQVFSAMATRDPSLDEITRTVARLNAWDKKHLGEPDYELRLKAFKRANQKLADEDSLDLRFFSPIIHNCFYFILKIEDMSMRDNASHLLTEVISKLHRSGRETAAFVTVIEHTFIPALRDGVRAKTEAARHETVAILSQLVKAFPEHPHFATMSVLLDKDVEVDFFENIRHIQHHRRMRALRRLSKQCQEGALSDKAIQHFLLPTATSMIFDPEVAKNMNLVVEAIAAVGAMARVLPWQQYLRLLTQYLRLLMKSLEYQKIAVRLIVAVLDAFHFDLSQSKGLDEKSSYRESGMELGTKELQGETYDTVVAGEEEEEKDDIDDDGKDGDEDGVREGEETGADSGIEDEKDKEDEKGIAMATRIHRTIARSILPQLHKIITKKTRSEGEHKKARNRMAEDEEVLRVPIALAVIKLLQALPKETMNQNLFSVLLKVCQMLRSRAIDVRSVTRETLVKILDSLGVGYFGLILKQLRSSLTRGYQVCHLCTSLAINKDKYWPFSSRSE
ncbi:small subunit processome component 20 homolog [Diadema antillarum]|uniref:small subunit processome component 20 homolog n=1 Tax=Diadema antillarum TaxID=105358 RepID=UPI003A899F93